MHTSIRPILFGFIATAALGQSPCPGTKPVETVRIRNFVVLSKTLPSLDREQLVHLFQQKSYPEPEIDSRVRQALRELGYFRPQTSDISFTPKAGSEIVDVTIKVEPGPQYRLGEIRFENATVFSSDQLRKLIALQEDDLFNATQFSKGMENMRSLYATRGYVDMVLNPVPIIDESRHVIDLTLSLDEGKPYNFGDLSLEGVEPNVGAAKALMSSWKPLEGKPYNSLELQKWFEANRSTWHAGSESWKAINPSEQPESHVVNITLKQPCW